MKSLNESIKGILKNNVLAAKTPEQMRSHSYFRPAVNEEDAAAEAPASEEPADTDVAPEAEEPEIETPAPKKSGEKPKYAAQCNKDGEEAVVLLSKDELEQLIHENGTKCIVKLYELGKEAKVPTVKVKV
jgi:hypothetical protein